MKNNYIITLHRYIYFSLGESTVTFFESPARFIIPLARHGQTAGTPRKYEWQFQIG